jgi:CheY-like chemotaxis protein
MEPNNPTAQFSFWTEIENKVAHAFARMREDIERESAERIKIIIEECKEELLILHEEIEQVRREIRKCGADIQQVREKREETKENIESRLIQIMDMKRDLENKTEVSLGALLKSRDLYGQMTELGKQAVEKNTVLRKTADRFGLDIRMDPVDWDEPEMLQEIQQGLQRIGRIREILGIENKEAEDFSETEEVVEPTPEQHQKNGRGIILIVEKDPAIAMLFKHFLMEEQYSIQVAEDGESAIKKAARNRPDLILLDVYAPNVLVTKFLGEEGEPEQSFKVPVIVMGPISEENMLPSYLEKGALDYITLPFSHKDVVEKVKKALQQ